MDHENKLDLKPDLTVKMWTWHNLYLITNESNNKSDCPLLTTGHYNLPDGVVFSMPVTFKNGKWTVFDVTVGDELREKLQLSADELREVRTSRPNVHAY